MKEKLLYQGAEAKIFLDEKENLILKERIEKSYRIPILDEKIRKHRTKTEKKLLEKASKIISAPNPLPLKEWNIIKMPFIRGKKLSEHLDNFPFEKQKEILKKIGEETVKIHDADIIHGDLTTSNLILADEEVNQKNYNLTKKRRDNNFQIFFIDFGLGFISSKAEDKAVDIHLLKQALEAKHFEHWEILYQEFLKSYKKSKESAKVIERLKEVEKRGRYRH